MKICLNMRLAIPNKMEGIGWYSFELAKRLIANHPECEFHLLYDRKVPDFSFHKNPKVKCKRLLPPARRPFLWKFWFNRSVSSYLESQNCELFVSFDGYLSLKTPVKQLSIIHDLNFEHYPEDLPESYADYFKKYFPLFAKKATRIATVSDYSKSDICSVYDLPKAKVDIVPNGVKDAFKPIDDKQKELIKAEFSNGEDFLLYIGSIHPRKNLKRLCEAFDQYKKKSNSSIKLLLVGAAMWKDDATSFLANLEFKDDIVRTGEQSLSTLASITASAKAIVYVSYFEGFGVPILEGFASDVPVICSNLTAMPEVAGDAAILVDPFDLNSISSGIERLMENPEIVDNLVQKGREQLKQFSWDQSALKLWESIQKTLA